jgi:2-oxoglutarate dehydrogenase E2 component (dihydrolipoamide succinyltransferase)
MEIKVPAVGESVFEALIARWLKSNGEHVELDEPLCEIETDKVTLEVTAEAAGVLSITVKEGETVKIGAVIGAIDEQGAVVAPAAQAAPQAEPTQAAAAGPAPPMSPSGRKLAREMGVEPSELKGSGRGGRLTNEDLLKAEPAQPAAASAAPQGAAPAPSAASQPAASALEAKPAPEKAVAAAGEPARVPASGADRVTRKPMSPIRKRIAQRLVSVRQNTAMLTSFNEADMTQIMLLRKKHGDFFLKRHGVKLGFMSLFVRACCAALGEFPEVNASIEGDDIVYHNFCDIGVAVGGEKGLVVPVLRSAETMTLAGIELAIAGFGEKVRTNRLALSDLEGGTFTISNGGVYGSLLSTPILNPPQSGVLGMHSIQERAVVRDGVIVIRPMMYLALSYDHRIVDGKGAVSFLKRVKEYLEEPEEMLLEG